LDPPDIEGVGARPCARAGNRSPETPVARTEPPAARRLRRVSTTVVMSIPPGDCAVAPPSGREQARDSLNLARLRAIFQLREAKRDRSQANAAPPTVGEPTLRFHTGPPMTD